MGGPGFRLSDKIHEALDSTCEDTVARMCTVCTASTGMFRWHIYIMRLGRRMHLPFKLADTVKYL